MTYLFGYAGQRKSVAEMERTLTWARGEPEFRRRIVALLDACPHDLGVGTLWRSEDVQAANYARDPKTFAPPGRSWHESSTPEGHALAVDLLNYQPAIGWADANAHRFGLHSFRTVNNEIWHYQPVEIPNRRYPTGSLWVNGLPEWKLPGAPSEEEDMPLSDEDIQRVAEAVAPAVAKAVWALEINDIPSGAKAKVGSVLGWMRNSAHEAHKWAAEAARNTR
jgi:hypothetical protein